MADPTTQAAERDPDEFAPCPRHGTRCYPEIPDLAQRVEVAIGLGDDGVDGVRAARDRIMMIIEDHVLAELADADAELEEARAHNDETCSAVIERDQLRVRLAAAEAQVAKHFQIASRYVGEGSTWAIASQALHAIDRALGGVQNAHDLRGLAGGIITFPPGTDAEDMARFRDAWDATAGPERALTLNVDNRTATFPVQLRPNGPVAREAPERTPKSGDVGP